MAETISNNIRSKITKEHLNDPAFYDTMSALLSEILADLKAQRIDYEEFLRRIAELAKQVQVGKAADTPEKLDTPGKRALYNNLNKDEALALRIDETVRRVRPNAWRNNQAKENAKGYTPSALWRIANDELNLRTRQGLKIARSNIYRLFTNPFYCGSYEWPRESGNWYQGKHKPMVTPEEYDRVQMLVGMNGRPRPKRHVFAFVGMMKCGECGLSIKDAVEIAEAA